MPEHRWSGWPGAWCLDCGCSDPREYQLVNMVDPDEVAVTVEQMECLESGSNRYNPYVNK